MKAVPTGRELVPGLVSTIIPVHNRPGMLAEAAASVQAQSYRPIEIVIVDDGSTDETGRAAEALAAAHPGLILVVHQENRGPGAARETGRLRARGEFVQYLDSDDLLLPEKFTQQVAGLGSERGCGVSYGMTRFQRIGEAPGSASYKRTGERIETMFPSFLQSRWWSTSTPLYRRSLLDAAGPWTDLWNEEDWEYDCRVASLGVRLSYTASFVSVTRAHGSHLCAEGESAKVLGQRARAHELILGHAHRFGIGPDAPEMRHFARELFLLSRQCGAVGLARESARLFELAREASGPARGRGRDFRLYRTGVALIGWGAMGRFSALVDRARAGCEGR
jgi:glycosyltransferase involved in cell wall biosynthesis